MDYQPLVSATSPAIKLTALVGATMVILGFDLRGPATQRAGLLGFAIERTQLADGATLWLHNPLKFARFPYAGYQVAGTDSRLAPIQQFHWGDDTVIPNQAYRYTLFTVYGTPAQPLLRDALALDIRTARTDHGALSLHFNRGVVATPAYRQQFANRPPDQQPPAQVAAAQAYLSRGLQEALLAFLDAAQPGDTLDIAIYEFEHASIVAALQAALARGVRVRLLYHAKADATDRANAAAIAQLRDGARVGTDALELVPRRNVPGLSHNKLIVHTVAGKAARIWTGSTNFTSAGFYLQTNVGIVVRDGALARAYASYFDLLHGDPRPKPLRQAVGALALRSETSTDTQLFFSPVAGDALLQAAVRLIRAAQDVVLISCPFGLDPLISEALEQLDPRVLVYGLLNTNQAGDLQVLNRGGVANRVFVLPEWIKQLNGATYDASRGRGNQIHVKSLVVDPWSTHPRVLLGSANFSDESVNQNDENALLIEGDGWAAAQVATEFLRVFDHYRFRNRIGPLAQAYDTQQPAPVPAATLGVEEGGGDEGAIWLVAPDDLLVDAAGDDADASVLGVTISNLWLDESDAWLGGYSVDGSPQQRERAVFVV